MSWWYAACTTWSWLLLVRKSWKDPRYGINAYIVLTKPMAKFFALLKVFFSCAFTYFLVTSAQWPLLVISPSYVSTDEKYAWNFLLESQIVKYHWCWFITIWLHILSSRYEWLKLSIDAHCFNFPRGAHLLVHPYCTLYSSLKNPYMQLP